MQKLINGIYAKFHQRGIVKADDRDVFEYGLDLLLFTLATNVTLLILGAVTGFFWHSLILMIAFAALQSTCGGYHAQTHMKCFITTAAGWGVGRLLITFLPDVLVLLMPLYGAIVIWTVAPLEHENAPMSVTKKARMRILGRTLMVCIVLCGAILYMVSNVYARPCFAAVFLSGVSLTAGKILNRHP